ncbi:MAG TPA: RNA-binding S4 domain-containing protein [Sulfurospirillum arcachonense]|nr:RNA-binding S4 domain-containing protein [Sulfurospirillum arcachonense]
MEFELKDDYIELFKLIKVMDLAQSGGHAKILIEEGLVKRNGEIELRKRAKILADETIDVDGDVIEIKK